MIANGVRDSLRLALRFGEIAADHALKLGELADHASDEVGLGQPRSALGLVGVSALDHTFLDQPARQLGDALDLVGDGTELFVEDDSARASAPVPRAES